MSAEQRVLDEVRQRAQQEYDFHIDTMNAIVENAGDEWDDDVAIDDIAIRYVRHLEARLSEVEGERDAARDSAKNQAEQVALFMADLAQLQDERDAAVGALRTVSNSHRLAVDQSADRNPYALDSWNRFDVDLAAARALLDSFKGSTPGPGAEDIELGGPCESCHEPIEKGFLMLDDEGHRYCEDCWQP